MEQNKVVFNGEGCCLLCLEVKEEFVDAIFIDSVQFNTINIKLLIEKYLWTMVSNTCTYVIKMPM